MGPDFLESVAKSTAISASNSTIPTPLTFLRGRCHARSQVLLPSRPVFCSPPPASAQEFFLKKGDVVVVMGDSITEQRLYSNYLEIWCQTRFPSYNLVFRNVGIGGDRSTGGNGRFKRDVLPFKPTVLTVDFGMNDGNYGPARSQRRRSRQPTSIKRTT